jgi:uncharacterized protein YegP (UPF0339 family)
MAFLRMLFGPKPQYRVEVFANMRHGWQWRIRHVNGNVLSTSEEYSSRGAAWDTASNLAVAAGFNCDEGV